MKAKVIDAWCFSNKHVNKRRSKLRERRLELYHFVFETVFNDFRFSLIVADFKVFTTP